MGTSKVAEKAKCKELKKAMVALGERLDAGDESSIFIEAIPGKLMCSYRPLRRHHDSQIRGPQRNLPQTAAPHLRDWILKMRGKGIQSIICLMGPAEFIHYADVVLELGEKSLIDLYKRYDFEVESIPWEDPKYPVKYGGLPYEDQLRDVRDKALKAFDRLTKPVLLHCSSGIQRSSPIAAFIYTQRREEPHITK